MPLGFPSLSHGTVAFGFFNIETDLLLLDRYFLFADLFCVHISRLAGTAGEAVEEEWDVHRISDRARIGDLMGAIHGVRYLGFIGEVYRRFPFPKDEAEFKQRPEGWRNRPVVEGILPSYAEGVRVPVSAEPGPRTSSNRGVLVWASCFPGARAICLAGRLSTVERRCEAGLCRHDEEGRRAKPALAVRRDGLSKIRNSKPAPSAFIHGSCHEGHQVNEREHRVDSPRGCIQSSRVSLENDGD